MVENYYSEKSLLFCDEAEELYYYKGLLFYHSGTGKDKVLRINKRLIAHCSLLSRMARMEPRVVCKTADSSFLIALRGKMFNYSPLNNSLVVEHEFCQSMNAPLYLCERKTKDSYEVYYGEYFQNTSGKPVSIFMRDNNTKTWKKLYEFPSGRIKHIHNILYNDSFQKFYIFTGDSDSESGIWEADIFFLDVKPLLVGSQKYRACFGFFEDDYLYYATDMPDSGNSVFRINLNTRTDCEFVKNIKGPCIYGMTHNNYSFFSTSVEPDSNNNALKYLLTRKTGNGVEDNYSHLYFEKNGMIEEITRIKKDIFPLALCQFGNIVFSKGMTKDLFFYLQSLRPKHGQTLTIKRSSFLNESIVG